MYHEDVFVKQLKLFSFMNPVPCNEGILSKGPYLPCLSMAGRALLIGCPRIKILLNYNLYFWHWIWWIVSLNIMLFPCILFTCIVKSFIKSSKIWCTGFCGIRFILPFKIMMIICAKSLFPMLYRNTIIGLLYHTMEGIHCWLFVSYFNINSCNEDSYSISGIATNCVSYTPCFNEVERGVLVSTCASLHLSICGQNRVRSVSSTILIGSILYLHILSNNLRRCVLWCNVCFKVQKFEILVNSINL